MCGHRRGRALWPFMLMLLVEAGMVTVGPPVRAESSSLPNLVPVAPYEIRIDLADDSTIFEGKLAIRFTAAVGNRSAQAFDLSGQANVPSEAPGPGDRLQLEGQAMQCVEWLAAVYDVVGTCTARQDIGRIYYHNEHQHWHLDRFVAYELRHLDSLGQPVMSADGLVVASKKVSFCLQDSEPEPERPDGAPLFDVNTYDGCASLATMGISPGYRDVYDWSLYDQQILLEGVPDGSYALVVHVNPDGRFLESTTEDDVAYQRITISGETLEVL